VRDHLEIALASTRIHEGGFRSRPYDDLTGELVVAPKGKITIAFGCNLQDGISKELGEVILRHQMGVAARDAQELFAAGWERCDAVRKAVLDEMSYQLGGPRLSDFVNLRAAVSRGDWNAAHDAMLDSAWARQVPKRANALALRMLHGETLDRMV